MLKKNTYKRAILICSLLFFSSLVTSAQSIQQRIKVGLFTGNKLTRVLIAPASDAYSVYAGDSLLIVLTRNDVLSVKLQDDSLELKNISKLLGVFMQIKVTPLVATSSLKIKPADGKAPEISCDNDLIISAGIKSLRLVNEVDIDNYVAGVVQAETGTTAPKEYYKIQAIMCRTFALENKSRHSSDGYALCDREHCQVFKGRSNKNPDIKLAVAATSGIVLVDSTNHLIFSAYHSNCGGQTDFSQNVWKTEKDYLKPVVDTFCVNSRNANWEKIISLHDWEKYLVKQNKDFSKPADSLYCFYQPQRKSEYELFGTKIPLTQIRKDLKLSSTFFHLEQDDDKIIFTGRGSGHGVGLCQQGAIEMASKGYSYKKILGYYYKGVRLVNYSKVKRTSP